MAFSMAIRREATGGVAERVATLTWFIWGKGEGEGEYWRGSISSSCEPRFRVWAEDEEVFASFVDAAVSESVIVEADSLLTALLLGGCAASDALLVAAVVVEKASAPGKPTASSSQVAAAATSP